MYYEQCTRRNTLESVYRSLNQLKKKELVHKTGFIDFAARFRTSIDLPHQGKKASKRKKKERAYLFIENRTDKVKAIS